jgi:hypothetical protein
VAGGKPATYDLPLHYRGQITEIGFPHQSNAAERPVLGKANGYQHIWVDATGAPGANQASLTWMLGKRFYSWHMLAPRAAADRTCCGRGGGDVHRAARVARRL